MDISGLQPKKLRLTEVVRPLVEQVPKLKSPTLTLPLLFKKLLFQSPLKAPLALAHLGWWHWPSEDRWLRCPGSAHWRTAGGSCHSSNAHGRRCPTPLGARQPSLSCGASGECTGTLHFHYSVLSPHPTQPSSFLRIVLHDV